MLQFTHEEVEENLANTLGNVTRKDIAMACQLSESYIKRQFNGNDEQMSCLFRALQIICGIDDKDEQIGEEFFNAFVNMRDLSKKRKGGQDFATIFDCLAKKYHLDGNFGAEITKALADGKLDKSEIQRLRPSIVAMRNLCDLFDDIFGNELQKDEITINVFGNLNIKNGTKAKV